MGEQARGPDDAKLMTGQTRSCMAEKAGASVAAGNQHAEALLAHGWVSGPKCPGALAVRRYLADWAREARDTVSARKQLAAMCGA
jgi:hypothetical protein